VTRYTFEDCRRGALQDLGDAADWLRYIDAPATARQRELTREVLDLIGQAKAKLDEAARSAR
jgi:hypothetical protein